MTMHTEMQSGPRGNGVWFFELAKLFHGQYGKLALSAFFFVVKASPLWILPLATRNILNALSPVTDGSRETILWNALAMLGLILQNIPTHMLHARLLSVAARNMQQHLRCALVARLQELSICFHGNFSAGRMQSKILRDVDAVETLSRQMFGVVLNSVVSMVVALGVTLSEKPVLALCFTLAAPFVVFLVQGFYGPMRRTNSAFRGEMESMSSSVLEMIDMIPVARAHGVEDHEERRLRRHFGDIRRKGLDLDLVNSLFGSLAWVVFQLFSLACLVGAAWLALGGNLRPGDVVMFTGYFGMLVSSVNSLVDFYPTLLQGREAIHSIGEVLECPDLERNDGKKTVTKVQGAITLRGVDFRYGNEDAPALSGIDLDIQAGECLALVGESGSGKTTLVNLIIGLRRPTAGRILLDGEDMESIDMRTYRQFLAVVSQNTLLFSGTIRENIAYGIESPDEDRFREVLRSSNVASFVDELPDGLETRLGERGTKLSGGQRQRISIARALIRDPRVIILDEATSALDVVSEKAVQEALQNLIRNRTTLIVAHRLSTIRTAHRIAVLQRGRIVELGSPETLLSRPGQFARMVDLQK